jgi:hypothetical protein
VGLANLGSESETCGGSRVCLVGVSISLEKNFYRLPFTPPSGSPYRSFKEERAGEGAAKWARGLPHVCKHKCLATTKRCRGSSEEGVEDLISDSGNNYDDGEASFSESHCLFTCSIDGA